jgi:hypothetical protein
MNRDLKHSGNDSLVRKTNKLRSPRRLTLEGLESRELFAADSGDTLSAFVANDRNLQVGPEAQTLATTRAGSQAAVGDRFEPLAGPQPTGHGPHGSAPPDRLPPGPPDGLPPGPPNGLPPGPPNGHPGDNPGREEPSAPAASDLQEVDVAHLGGSPSGPLGAYVVTAVGTGAEARLSSWKVTDDVPAPVHLQDGNDFDGRDVQLTVLYPAEDPELARRPFLVSRIGSDGNLWLDSYHLTIPGSFVSDDTRGYGSNADVTVVEHATAQRPAGPDDEFALVVTPIVASDAEGQTQLRIVTWRVNVDTQEVQGLADSGPLDVDLPASGSELGIVHQTAGIFVVNYTNASGNLVSRYVGVADNGLVLDAGGGASGNDFQGGSYSQAADASATAPLGNTSYVAAVEENGEVALTVWERRVEGCFFLLCSYEPYLVGQNDDDASPQKPGITIPEPDLSHAYEASSSAGENFGSSVVTGDFNGDGFEDVAVGAPGESVDGNDNAGAVTVIYGSADGLFNSEHNWTFHQGTSGIIGSPDEGDQFGYSLAAGDFDGDGRDDLAIGVPGESIEAENLNHAGVVQVLYGSGNGLTASGDQLFQQGVNGLVGVSESEDWFGWSLAAGDFDGDGRDDLAIGAPQEDHNAAGHTDAGAIHVIYGSAAGLSAAGDVTLHQDSANVLGTADDEDQFGYALAVGDFNDDGRDDLAVGVPGEAAFGLADAGAVQVFRGSNSGLSTNDQLISQDGIRSNANVLLGDISDSTEAGDRFGAALAAGDFNGDGYADLAIGAPEEDLEGQAGIHHGRVHAVYGSSSGIGAADEQLWDQLSGGMVSDPEPGGRFGFALTTGDVDNDGYDELLVGVPYQDSDAGGGVTYANSGIAILMDGTPVGLTASGSHMVKQGVNSIGDAAEPGDHLGFALAIGDLDGDGFHDAVIGVPNQLNSVLGHEQPFSGSIHVVYADDSGLTTSDELWAQGTARHIRAMVSDSGWESEYGIGGGTLFERMPSGEPEAVHTASVTKVLTLLLAVEALESGAVSLDDPVTIDELAAGTGGSQMDPNVEEDDIVLLETLLYGMTASSGNSASFAIGNHIAIEAMGAPDDDPEAAFDTFVAAMNDRADELGMADTQVGHPAGGMVTTPQDLITLFREGWRHPLFRQFADSNFSYHGEALNGDPPKEWDLVRSNSYVGIDGEKGGHGRVGSVQDENGETINVPRCTECHVAQATRADHSLIAGVQQSSEGWSNSRRLLDYGFQTLFTPDHRGYNDLEVEGPVFADPTQPVMGSVSGFAVDHITDTWVASAAIDDFGHLQVQTWSAQVTPGTVEPLGGLIQAHTGLKAGNDGASAAGVDIVRLPASGKILGDYLTGSIDGGELRLDVWRIGAEVVPPTPPAPPSPVDDFELGNGGGRRADFLQFARDAATRSMASGQRPVRGAQPLVAPAPLVQTDVPGVRPSTARDGLFAAFSLRQGDARETVAFGDDAIREAFGDDDFHVGRSNLSDIAFARTA